jgi:signal transduction histidine kinase/CheY-like chemotaxis protein
MVVTRRIWSTVLATMLFAAPVATPPTAWAKAAPAPSASAAPFDARLAAAKAAMMGDPQAALTLSSQALDLAKADPGPKRAVEIASAQWLQGEALLRLNRFKEAIPVIAAGLKVAAAEAPDTKLHGDLLMTQAALEAEQGQVQTALRDYQAAYRIFVKAGQARSQSVALQNIGSIYQDAHDYRKVLHYYALSAEAYPADQLLQLSAANNIGNALMSDAQFDRAVTELERARKIAHQMGSPQLEARITANLAIAQARAGRTEIAKTLIDDARALLRPLPDAQAAQRSVRKASAQVELTRGHPQAALAQLAPLLAGVDPKTTGSDFLEIHAAAYRAYQQLGDTRQALVHLEAFKRLDDQGQALAASTNAALMAAQFDYANQASRIAQLKSGQLQRDVKLARSRNTVITLLLAGSMLTGAVLLAAVLGVRRSRNLARAANRKLRESNLALEKAVRARTEFLAATSHELRTPLNGVLGMAEVMLAEPDLAPRQRERVDVINAGAQTMRALVDDILDLARIETDGVTLRRAPLDLPRLCREAVQVWTGKAAAKGLGLSCEIAGVPAQVIEDAGRLRQILFVLLSNAVKFTAEGTVRLSADVDPTGQRLVLRVADTGAGIPADKLAEVFEPFHQADSSRTRAHGGAGLGLAICRRLVDAMGGEIGLDTAVDRGTTVTVVLPLIQAVAPSPSPAPASRLDDCGLLLCDPNPLTLSVLKAVLRPRLQLLEATPSREDALEAALGRRFDLALIDAAALGGGETRQASLAGLRDALGPAAIVVLLAQDDPGPDHALHAAGATLVVRKPVTALTLVETLGAVLDPARSGSVPGEDGTKAIATA